MTKKMFLQVEDILSDFGILSSRIQLFKYQLNSQIQEAHQDRNLRLELLKALIWVSIFHFNISWILMICLNYIDSWKLTTTVFSKDWPETVYCKLHLPTQQMIIGAKELKLDRKWRPYYKKTLNRFMHQLKDSNC